MVWRGWPWQPRGRSRPRGRLSPGEQNWHSIGPSSVVLGSDDWVTGTGQEGLTLNLQPSLHSHAFRGSRVRRRFVRPQMLSPCIHSFIRSFNRSSGGRLSGAPSQPKAVPGAQAVAANRVDRSCPRALPFSGRGLFGKPHGLLGAGKGWRQPGQGSSAWVSFVSPRLGRHVLCPPPAPPHAARNTVGGIWN